MITLKEIKDATCGEDINGKSKAISVIGAHRYNMANTTEEPQVIAEFSSTEPIVNIIISGDITWINLKFISEKSELLSMFFRTLERYLEETDKNTEDNEAVAFLTFLPLEFAGQYYITAMHPIMWALEPEAVGEDMRTLRVAFFSENVSFLESDLDEDFFDMAKENAAETDSDNLYYQDDTYDDRDLRNSEFIDSDKYIADFDDDDEDDDDDYEDDEDDEEDDEKYDPLDRTGYIYH